MHSSPIDLLVRAPGQPKAQPPESDSDGRFSELLRQPSDTAAEPPASGPKESAAEAGATPNQDMPAGEDPVQAQPGAGAAPADKAAIVEAGETFLEAMAVVPDAITHSAGTAPVAETAVVATGPISQAPPTDPALVQPSAPERPLAEAPLADLTSNGVPTPGTAGEQRPVSIGGQTGLPTPLTQSGSGAPEVAPMPKAAATPESATNPASPAVQPTQTGVDAIRTAPVLSTTAGETNPAGIAGNAATPAVPDAATSAGTVPSAQASATATRIPAAPERAVSAAPEPQAVPEQAELADGPDPAALATPAGTKTAVKAGATVRPGLATTLTAAARTSDRSAAMMAQPTARPDTAAVELPASNAHQDVPAAVSTQAARPTVEATLLAPSTGNTATPPPASEQVVLQLRRAVADGIDRLTVQLKPASLGRVDVQMEVGHDGRVQAVISAERPETLHLLQRDARALTTAFNEAGLQADSDSLSFNLRGQTGDDAGGREGLADAGAPASGEAAADDGDDAIAPITLTLGAGRVDIKV